MASRVVGVARFVVGTLLLLVVALNLANVIGRYILLKPIIWADEVMLFANNVWAVMIGMAIATWMDGHLRMEAIFDLAPPGARRVLTLLSALLTAALSVLIIFLSLQTMAELQHNNQHSVIARVPLAYMYLALPVGFGLTLLALAARLWLLLRGRPELESASQHAPPIA